MNFSNKIFSKHFSQNKSPLNIIKKRRNLINVVCRNLTARIPSIHFIGKRSLVEDSSHTSSTPVVKQSQSQSNQSNQSNTSSTSSSSSSVDSRQALLNQITMRKPYESEEIDFVNNGGPDTFMDWNKIKYKSKI